MCWAKHKTQIAYMHSTTRADQIALNGTNRKHQCGPPKGTTRTDQIALNSTNRKHQCGPPKAPQGQTKLPSMVPIGNTSVAPQRHHKDRPNCPQWYQ
ncbi:hypothetical protein J6590_015058 [Homalodisca vitripennis]|nr:hypothetical protein J6590_015058 [Homalodisca vitripennis]